MYNIFLGDNIDVLKDIPDNYYDSVVTDPPYGLGKEPDATMVLHDWIEFGYHEISGSGFMGKKWDSFVPQPNFWKEVFRVLKHGGHVVSFAGTRTYDWMVMSMRLAGFEIRDMITWNYGSGFPKSHNISKALDKMNGVEGKKILAGSSGKKRKCMSGDFHGGDYFKELPSSEDAKKWEGYGTALKPSIEPIVLARKPISEKSISENVLKWGTGALNIDGCRIGLEGIENHKTEAKGGLGNNVFGKFENKEKELTDIPRYDNKGRFPANSIYDETTAKELDKQTGILKSGSMSGIYKNTIMKGEPKNRDGKDIELNQESSEGGASRFFFQANFQDNELDDLINFYYCAKTSQTERNAGCEKLDKKSNMRVNAPRANEEEKISNELGNFHPTVKPIELMRYLVRLITPKGGRVLEPFAGSGTTGIASLQEGFDVDLIEMTEEYIPIIEKE